MLFHQHILSLSFSTNFNIFTHFVSVYVFLSAYSFPRLPPFILSCPPPLSLSLSLSLSPHLSLSFSSLPFSLFLLHLSFSPPLLNLSLSFSSPFSLSLSLSLSSPFSLSFSLSYIACPYITLSCISALCLTLCLKLCDSIPIFVSPITIAMWHFIIFFSYTLAGWPSNRAQATRVKMERINQEAQRSDCCLGNGEYWTPGGGETHGAEKTSCLEEGGT